MDLKKIPVYKFDNPINLRIELQTSSQADLVALMHDVKRIDGVTIELIHNDYAEVFDTIDAMATLARAAKW
jgi:D-aminopeptidase